MEPATAGRSAGAPRSPNDRTADALPSPVLHHRLPKADGGNAFCPAHHVRLSKKKKITAHSKRQATVRRARENLRSRHGRRYKDSLDENATDSGRESMTHRNPWRDGNSRKKPKEGQQVKQQEE